MHMPEPRTFIKSVALLSDPSMSFMRLCVTSSCELYSAFSFSSSFLHRCHEGHVLPAVFDNGYAGALIGGVATRNVLQNEQ